MQTKTFDSQTARFISSVVTCLPSEMPSTIMQEWIDNPKNLKKALSGLAPLPVKVWKTIKIGNGLSANDFIQKVHVYDSSRTILRHRSFTVSNKEEDVNLVVMSVGDLGCEDGALYRVICSRAIKLGLELCPAEVGPQLRLQYKDQPNFEWLLIAMNPIMLDGIVKEQYPKIFSLSNKNIHGEAPLLEGHGYNKDDYYEADIRFVFRLPK